MFAEASDGPRRGSLRHGRRCPLSSAPGQERTQVGTLAPCQSATKTHRDRGAGLVVCSGAWPCLEILPFPYVRDHLRRARSLSDASWAGEGGGNDFSNERRLRRSWAEAVQHCEGAIVMESWVADGLNYRACCTAARCLSLPQTNGGLICRSIRRTPCLKLLALPYTRSQPAVRRPSLNPRSDPLCSSCPNYPLSSALEGGYAWTNDSMRPVETLQKQNRALLAKGADAAEDRTREARTKWDKYWAWFDPEELATPERPGRFETGISHGDRTGKPADSIRNPPRN